MEKQEQMFGDESRKIVIVKNEEYAQHLSFKALLERFYLMNPAVQQSDKEAGRPIPQGNS